MNTAPQPDQVNDPLARPWTWWEVLVAKIMLFTGGLFLLRLVGCV